MELAEKELFWSDGLPYKPLFAVHHDISHKHLVH